MRVVHGERPPIRHAGLYKVSGPQYVRGVSEWSTDGSRKDDGAFWLAYSVGKEDIWVSRVPMPAKADAWNVYSPKLAPVTVKDGEIVIEDHDPFDYARASRVLDGRKHVDVSFTVDAERGTLLLDFEGPQGQIGAQIGLRDGDYRVVVDCVTKTHSVWRDGKPLVENARLVLPIEQIERVSFRTGEGGALVEPTQFTIKAFKL
jgi:hypothetical protein